MVCAEDHNASSDPVTEDDDLSISLFAVYCPLFHQNLSSFGLILLPLYQRVGRSGLCQQRAWTAPNRPRAIKLMNMLKSSKYLQAAKFCQEFDEMSHHTDSR